jgi:hypothetical protein
MSEETTGRLIEEFLEGPLYSVDCAVLNGEVTPVMVAHHVIDFDPQAILSRTVTGPGTVTPDVESALIETARSAALACGLDRTIAHVEFKWTSLGPRIVEINGRPGGGEMPELLFLTTGTKMGELLADVASGRRPEKIPASHQSAGWTWLYPSEPVLFGGLQVPDDLKTDPRIIRIESIAALGELVTSPLENPWGRAGLAMVKGLRASDVHAHLETLRQRIEVSPLESRYQPAG